MPSVSVLDAVAELRQQLHGERPTAKTLYTGRRSGIEPMRYLMENYGADIRQGRLSAGQLHTADSTLYMSLRAELLAQTPPRTVSQLFDELTAENKRGGVYRRRFDACCEILDASEEEAARFLANLRTSRLKTSTVRPFKPSQSR
jgi:hypothetical protein